MTSPEPPITPGTPTQVAHPWKATLRTVVAYVVALVPVLVIAIPIITDGLGPYLPEGWVAWLLGAAAFLATLVAVVTRLMAVQQVQSFLAMLGLGTGVEREPTHRAG